MLKIVKPLLEHKEKYKEMICEWQQYGGPYAPCIIEYDCGNPIDQLDYSAVLRVVDDYSKGNIFDYDVDYFERSDFYFIFDDDELIGMGEIRHNLKPAGLKVKGHITCGIRPSKRRQEYAFNVTRIMVEKLRHDQIKEVVICHDHNNIIIPRIMKKLDFKYIDSEDVYDTVIMRYMKKFSVRNGEK